ncbi:MAG: acetyl-CoA carboxylase biotin carboxylase subunit [Deltaproteobacteria bacterium]|nr:acetyl-CoA carboxylase biotin carboxylase subunit [Deltaproteobacteria bacterium]
MFKKILIANRGEIALRVMNTCREMGIATIAVYSDADSMALHKINADQAVYIGKSDPADSYLNMDKIIDAAKETHADAIHPGYGFLSENADFARRCESENIVFIGPPARVIDDLGDKTKARLIMKKGGVPVIPGMTQSCPDHAVMAKEAKKIGYPVLIKAAAGGGGKGMRVVDSETEMEDACNQAQSEAKAAFGNNAVYLEKYLKKTRHVEFQVLADTRGNVVHLLERECSIQRRHQKIIEETPSFAMTPELREEMGKAAVAAARASGYVNAGTVEFLLDTDGKFYFLEVNTRLQVEHPITEMITNIDIVRQQIQIAAGMPLDFTQNEIRGRGHAIECRIYGEDPENSFFPSPGKISYIKEPAGPGVRNDCGVYSGFEVPMEYDPIISKLIVYAADRKEATCRMINALSQYVVMGIKTPIAFLMDVLASEQFQEGETFTDFIETSFDGWKQNADDADLAALIYIIDEMAGKKHRQSGICLSKVNETPWQTLGNWRM